MLMTPRHPSEKSSFLDPVDAAIERFPVMTLFHDFSPSFPGVGVGHACPSRGVPWAFQVSDQAGQNRL